MASGGYVAWYTFKEMMVSGWKAPFPARSYVWTSIPPSASQHTVAAHRESQ